jgi:AhpD family alkylhydroperoxidase
MAQRLNYAEQSPELMKVLLDLGAALRKSPLDEKIQLLVQIRASQINGCAFCLDMHIKQAKIHGEGELRLHHVAIWRESPLFDAREKAAFAWTEALTHLPAHGIADAVYDAARAQFSEKELTDLTYAVMAINAWNRLNIAFPNVPGSKDKMFGLDKAAFT